MEAENNMDLMKKNSFYRVGVFSFGTAKKFKWRNFKLKAAISN